MHGPAFLLPVEDDKAAADQYPAQRVYQAGRRADTEPTEGQAEAGNYRKGHTRIHGLEVSIENPKGSTRSGTDPDGNRWEQTLTAHYGYIRRTEGADGDHVDVFIGPRPEAEVVFVINQLDPRTGEFDEHKGVLGCLTRQEAKELYLSNYEDGWQGCGEITPMTIEQFKWWLENGDLSKPIENGFFAARKAATDNKGYPTPPEIHQRRSQDEHYKIVCGECGTQMETCRCDGGPNGKTVYHSLCEDCGGDELAGLDEETKRVLRAGPDQDKEGSTYGFDTGIGASLIGWNILTGEDDPALDKVGRARGDPAGGAAALPGGSGGSGGGGSDASHGGHGEGPLQPEAARADEAGGQGGGSDAGLKSAADNLDLSQTFDPGQLYRAVAEAETGHLGDPVNAGSRFIRTQHAPEGGSSAYGPVQLTNTLLRDMRERNPQLIEPYSDYASRFLEQGEQFLRYGQNPEMEGYHPKYDYGGMGDLAAEQYREPYREMNQAILGHLQNRYGGARGALEHWRGEPPSEDQRWWDTVRQQLAGGAATQPATQPATQSAENPQTTRTPSASHTIEEGETLWGVAQKHYNDPQRWTDIADANEIADPGAIQPGQEVKLPDLEKGGMKQNTMGAQGPSLQEQFEGVSSQTPSDAGSLPSWSPGGSQVGASLEEYLPQGYREEAIPAARQYRDRQAGNWNFQQDLSPGSIRQEHGMHLVPGESYSVGLGHVEGDSGVGARWDPSAQVGAVGDVASEPESAWVALGHELTHASQGSPPWYSASNDTDRMEETFDRAVSGDTASYLANPRELEAHLADMKRKVYEQTGAVHSDPEEIRKILRHPEYTLGEEATGNLGLASTLRDLRKVMERRGEHSPDPFSQRWVNEALGLATEPLEYEALLDKLSNIWRGVAAGPEASRRKYGEAAERVPREVRESAKSLPREGGRGELFYHPGHNRVHYSTGDWFSEEQLDQARDLLEGLSQIAGWDIEPERGPEGEGWYKIDERGRATLMEKEGADGPRRICPGCGEPFAEDEPYPDADMCEVCERYGPSRPAEDRPERAKMGAESPGGPASPAAGRTDQPGGGLLGRGADDRDARGDVPGGGADPGGSGSVKTAEWPDEVQERYLAQGDAPAFWEFTVATNQENRDGGELGDISEEEWRRLGREWQGLSTDEKLRWHRRADKTADADLSDGWLGAYVAEAAGLGDEILKNARLKKQAADETPESRDPSQYVVAPSPIHGWGVFAGRDIGMGERIERGMENLGRGSDGKAQLWLTPLTRYMNWSRQPNIEIVPEDESGTSYAVHAAHPIPAGRELTATPHYMAENAAVGSPSRAVLVNGTRPDPNESAITQALLADASQPLHPSNGVDKEASAGYILPDEKASAEEAKGIPDRRDYGELTELQPGEELDLVEQEHDAEKAGPHVDLRIGDKQRGMLSWAIPKGVPGPGERRLGIRQPRHAHSYRHFEGEIPKGQYGAGKVRTKRLGKALVNEVAPEKINLTVSSGRHPERLTLVKPNPGKRRSRDWLVINTTPSRPPEGEKVRQGQIPGDKVEDALEKMEPGSRVQPKVDGALVNIKLHEDGLEVMSHRARTDTGALIPHTERVFRRLPKGRIPKKLVGTVLRGELYGQRQEDGNDGAR